MTHVKMCVMMRFSCETNFITPHTPSVKKFLNLSCMTGLRTFHKFGYSIRRFIRTPIHWGSNDSQLLETHEDYIIITSINC